MFNFMQILRPLLLILPFFLLCLAGTKVNLKKEIRSRQFPMPVIALIYCIVVFIFLERINSLIFNLVTQIPALIGSFSPDIASAVESFIDNLNLAYHIFYITNPLILTAYLILKKIILVVLQRLFKKNRGIYEKIAGWFYDYFQEKNIWTVKPKFGQVRTYFKVFYYTAIVLASLIFVASRWMMTNNLIITPFYPVFGVLIIGELYFYLDGITKREYLKNILGEDEESYKVVNYSLMRNVLRRLFGSQVAAENTIADNSAAVDVTNDEIIESLLLSEDSRIEVFGKYYKALLATGFELDQNYIYSSLDLLNGKSVLFNNPFYNDLIPYAFYPMNRTLLRHKKVMIILGRHGIEKDIESWLTEGVTSITNVPTMWRIGELGEETKDIDIGIISRSNVHNLKLHETNREFFSQVEFVVIIEPSKLISTAQVGLNSLIRYCRTDERNIVFCSCDKNCDGLIDSLSHILMTSLIDVSATNKQLGSTSYICWDYTGEYWQHKMIPNISRYLGIGTELSVSAIKNQIETTKWYGGEAYPVVDQFWISRQYYYDLLRYAGQATKQERFSSGFQVAANLWSAKADKNQYMTVEDESNNMFEVVRTFSTRAKEQGFLNIISPEYLLKDYMTDKSAIFFTDPKAIPYIVADYARTNRNVALRMILMLSTNTISEAALKDELILMGYKNEDVKSALWLEILRCYSPAEREYDIRTVLNEEFEIIDVNSDEILTFNSSIIRTKQRFDYFKGYAEEVFFIDDPLFLQNVVSEMQSAGYIAEDEEGYKFYLGAELSGHIFQRCLPGQFFTFNGKYYEMRGMSGDNQVIVSRAADHLSDRRAYRQMRKYTILSSRADTAMGKQKDISGLIIAYEYADLIVETPAYMVMPTYRDFAHSKTVKLNAIPVRSYKNKQILRLGLPDIEDDVRYTVTVLLNEIFRTIFAENQAFISAVTDTGDKFDFEEDPESDEIEDANDPAPVLIDLSKIDIYNLQDIFDLSEAEPISSGNIDPLTFRLDDQSENNDKNSIYIIEDSQLDLGLLIAVERNLDRILEIVCDYLDWHIGAMEQSENPPDEPEPQPYDPDADTDRKPVKKGFFGRLWDKIKGLFRRKSKQMLFNIDYTDNGNDSGEPDEPDYTAPETENPETEDLKTENLETEDLETEDFEIEEPEIEDLDTDDHDPDADGFDPDDLVTINAEEEEITTSAAYVIQRIPYHLRHFLLFGADDGLPGRIKVEATRDYLAGLGFLIGSLKQARDNEDIAKQIEETYDPTRQDTHFCDFCGIEMIGAEYEVLKDGRERCMNCGRTAIKTSAEFAKVLKEVMRNMETFFGVKLNVGIHIEMVNSQKLHKRLNQSFVPTKDRDPRVLGVAIKDRAGYSILIENGSPRMASIMTIAHELTHIWQFINWNDKNINAIYGKDMNLEIYEGMSKWVEIQYAILINEVAVAKREEIETKMRDDAYGHGFIKYLSRYPFSMGSHITKPTPFNDVNRPL